MNKAFFLDRDGTLNVDYNYVHQPQEWSWCRGAVEALRWMQEHRFTIIVVTNQSGIARGRYAGEDVEKLHEWVDEQLRRVGIQIDDWFYAPYHPEFDPGEKYDPRDRKPSTGMFEKAGRKHDIDFKRSYMAGDKVTDLIPAVELGMTPLFIRSRHEPKQDQKWLNKHNIPKFDNIKEAVEAL